jgi:hypothetical protein
VSEMTREDALAHFGVMGMKWGHHKTPVGSAPAISNSRADIRQFGNRGATRINANRASGLTRKAAIAKEKHRRRVQTASVLTAGFLVLNAPRIRVGLQILANSAVAGKLAFDGAKAAERLFSDSHGIANHKLIDLGWDAVSGSWK